MNSTLHSKRTALPVISYFWPVNISYLGVNRDMKNLLGVRPRKKGRGTMSYEMGTRNYKLSNFPSVGKND